MAAALGPQLVAAAVPAIVAMQGNFAMASAARFTSILFRELAADGQIERALTEARAALRDQADWWAPILFTRLREGKIWG